MNKRVRYIYLSSTSYSGSTLLARLVNAHPQVVSIGELSNVIGRLFKEGQIDEYACSCGKEIRECSFWLDVQQECVRRGIALDLHSFGTQLDSGLGSLANSLLFGAAGNLLPIQYLLNLVFTRRISMVKEQMERTLVVAESVVSVDSADVFFDTSKNVGRVLFLLHHSGIDFKLLHLSRDPRGFLNSYLKHKGENADPRRALSYWKRTHQSAILIERVLGEAAYCQIRYEELCRNPRQVFRTLFQFIDLPYVDVVEEAKTHPHHIIGNAVRLRPFEGIHLDSSWKRELTSKQIEECLHQVGPVAELLGYA